MMPIKHIVLLGAGNLATHLTRAFTKKGYHILQVYNRTPGHGKKLARNAGAAYIGSLEQLDRNADLYILAVNDSAIREIAGRIRIDRGLVVHTSGSVRMDELATASPNYGVFYPLQTFRKDKRISFGKLPVCVEANSQEGEKALLHLAGQVSSNVHLINSEQRKVLHMTAVFAGNFSNFMYAIAEELLQKHGIPFDLLKPLIRQTASNVKHTGLFSLQTGPAIREDFHVLEEHRELLAEHAVYMEIYDLISKSIIKQKRKNGKL
ncbi:MAG: Rossmann-like and DUF2520 domain-containing protein [bacterium]